MCLSVFCLFFFVFLQTLCLHSLTLSLKSTGQHVSCVVSNVGSSQEQTVRPAGFSSLLCLMPYKERIFWKMVGRITVRLIFRLHLSKLYDEEQGWDGVNKDFFFVFLFFCSSSLTAALRIHLQGIQHHCVFSICVCVCVVMCLGYH